MIRYALQCDQNHHFEMWFRDSKTFNSLVENAMVECPDCGSTSVKKSLMAPSVPAKSDTVDVPASEKMGPRAVAEQIRAYREQVFTNTTDVGDRFPDEARQMHTGETEHRPIRGQATQDEVKALRDDGVPILPVPPEPPKEN